MSLFRPFVRPLARPLFRGMTGTVPIPVPVNISPPEIDPITGGEGTEISIVDFGTWDIPYDDYEVQWFLNGVEIAGETGDSLIIGEEANLDKITAKVRVRVIDGGWSEWAESNEFVYDPIAGLDFSLRLQTHRGDGAPLGLYLDTACTTPATTAGDPIAAWRDELSGSGIVAIQPTSTKRPTLRFTSGIPWLEFDGVDDLLRIPGNWGGQWSASSGVQRITDRVSNWETIAAAGNGNMGPVWILAAKNPNTGNSVASFVGGAGVISGTTRKNGTTSPLTTAAGEWCVASGQGFTANAANGFDLLIGAFNDWSSAIEGNQGKIGITSLFVQAGDVSVAAVDAYAETLNPASEIEPPTHLSGGSISGGTELDAELTASDPTWSNDPTSTSREWEVNETPTGETGTTYDDPREDGDSVTCVFYASNAAGSATPYRSNAIVAEDGPDFDPDAQDWIDRTEEADALPLEDGVRAARNQYILALKAATSPDGGTNWTAIAAGSALMMPGAHTLAGALVPIHASMPPPTNTNFVGGDYNRKTGLKGDGSTKRISLGIQVSTIPIANRGLTTFSTTHHTRNIARADLGAVPSATNQPTLVSTSTIRYYRTGGSEFQQVDASTTPGFWGATRYGTGRTGRYNGSQLTNTDAGTDLNPTAIVGIFSAGAGVYSDARLAWGGYHEAVDMAALESAIATYIAAIAAALP